MKELTATEVLTTTRTVRRRLDLTRPVDRATILECIGVALQAPIGGNIERSRWILVEDLEQKAMLAELYRDAAVPGFLRARDSAESDSTRRVYDDAIGLAQNLDRVPVIVVPCCLGTPPPDAAGAAGFFGSILPATWSFQLALRVRGLGSAYTSAVLSRASELRGLLSLPAEVTPAAMIPVGYTKGTQFRPARRSDPIDVTYIDKWGRVATEWMADA